MSDILYGTDPESFAAVEKDGKLYALPPYFFRKSLEVPASDDPKHPVFLENDLYAVHEDGGAFEFRIRPSKNPRELFDTIQLAAKETSEKILQHFPEYCQPNLKFIPTIGWDIERWLDMPEDFFMSTRFGCDKDSDVWNLESEESVEDASTHPWRYAGGHLHLSGSPIFFSDPDRAVKNMAMTAGLAATAYSPYPQGEHDRTHRYGRPGRFRPQFYGENNPYGPEYAHGMEYRTCSATWRKLDSRRAGIKVGRNWCEMPDGNFSGTGTSDAN